MDATPESVMEWLYANFDARTVAGQPGYQDKRVTALVAWCNATRQIARGGQSKRDKVQSEEYVRRGEPLLPR